MRIQYGVTTESSMAQPRLEASDEHSSLWDVCWLGNFSCWCWISLANKSRLVQNSEALSSKMSANYIFDISKLQTCCQYIAQCRSLLQMLCLLSCLVVTERDRVRSLILECVWSCPTSTWVPTSLDSSEGIVVIRFTIWIFEWDNRFSPWQTALVKEPIQHLTLYERTNRTDEEGHLELNYLLSNMIFQIVKRIATTPVKACYPFYPQVRDHTQ